MCTRESSTHFQLAGRLSLGLNYILLFQQLRYGCGDNNFNRGVSFVFPWHDETHEHIENSEREFYITARACIF
jgi:hypothetical protein